MTISREGKRRTPPRGATAIKKMPGSMPKMPTLSLSERGSMSLTQNQQQRNLRSKGTASTQSTDNDGDGDDDDDEIAGEKEDERRMAEIIIKLQLAKQKATESKKVNSLRTYCMM
jgi:hypothetical protein